MEPAAKRSKPEPSSEQLNVAKAEKMIVQAQNNVELAESNLEKACTEAAKDLALATLAVEKDILDLCTQNLANHKELASKAAEHTNGAEEPLQRQRSEKMEQMLQAWEDDVPIVDQETPLPKQHTWDGTLA
eukprot:NODE_6372_length_542_cov_55.626506_g6207_i0.p1 GENE.NODE_6372_length_542_cov_55.626506_g6207_i0~~NODE_6372_length_542_cov_55.626506_g6207_i0.p1  ORF type:complete len:149 (-),score=38.85 NODE_6372_length_542_cov_55.626506_g6207_i0:96-488(-)